jgi:hypothetical protein
MTIYCNACKRDYKNIKAHYKTNKHQKNIEKEEKQNETYDCEICFVDYPLSEFVTLPCNHKYCKHCIQHILKIKIEEKKVRNIICPHDNCTSEISFAIIKEILTPEMFEKYDKALLENTFINDKECIFCPVPDCGNPIYGVKSHPKIICRKCEQKICYNCKTVGWHKGDCKKEEEKQDDSIKTWMKESGAKPCPNCKVPIEKNKGCNHIYCINCKHHFYWDKPKKKYTGSKYIPLTETEWNERVDMWHRREANGRNDNIYFNRRENGGNIDRGRLNELTMRVFEENRPEDRELRGRLHEFVAHVDNIGNGIGNEIIEDLLRIRRDIINAQ